jgi:adenine phosphoribosyltransferase
VTTDELRKRVREVPDYPVAGVSFKDVTPLLADREALATSIRLLADWARPRSPELVVGCEARGFTVGAGIAYELGCGFAAARRPGKLPTETVRADYRLEYGSNTLELQEDAIRPGARVVIHDDILAVGGTTSAVAELVEKLGGTVAGITFLAEIAALGGRERLAGYDVHALISY